MYLIWTFNLQVSGERTLGENVADNGGLKAAYHVSLSMNKAVVCFKYERKELV